MPLNKIINPPNFFFFQPIQGSLARTKFYEVSYCMHHENIPYNTTKVDAEQCSLDMKYLHFPNKSICIRANTDIGFSPYSTFIFNENSSGKKKETNQNNLIFMT